MFRRVFTSVPNLVKGLSGVGLAGITLAASANAISEAELKKKPFWYQESVQRLEKALQLLSLYSYLDREGQLDDAIDILRRCENVNNCEITWRLGRALTERAELLSARSFEDRTNYFTQAIDCFRKAMTIEPAKGCAGLHKWYAIGLRRLLEVSSRHPYAKNARKEIGEHLEKAVKIDPNDALAWHLLGVHYYEIKKFDTALEKLLKAEELKKEYYPSNIYYIGMVYSKQGKKEQAIEVLKKTFKIYSHNKFDRKSKAQARAQLFLKYKIMDVGLWEEY